MPGKRMLVLLPVALFTMLCIGVGISSNRKSENRPNPTSESERPSLPEPTLSTLHRDLGHWFVVAQWVLLPACALLPLGASWPKIRRKVLAVCAMLAAGLGTAAFTLLTSLTGFLIGGMEQHPADHAAGSLRRMKALHVLGFPLLLALSIVLLWWISIRLARRCGRSASDAPPQAQAE